MVSTLLVLPLGIQGFQSNVVDLVLQAGLVTKIVLVVLLCFSIISWAIIFFKAGEFRKAAKENKAFLRLYGKNDDLTELRRATQTMKNGPLAILFLEGLNRSGGSSGPSKGNPQEGRSPRHPASVERLLKAISQDEVSHLEEYLSFLATTGNVSPFIGLFGTVWGIIDAFQQIGHQGTASIAAVAPGVSEALIATAAGLFAAIPAVVAFNFFLNRIRITANQMDAFSAEFIGLLEDRHADAQGAR